MTETAATGQINVLCFGGPLNERVMTIPSNQYALCAAIPQRQSFDLSDETVPSVPAPRIARYDVEKVGVTLPGTGPIEWRVAVVEGFPRHRITDQMNAILALCRFPWAGWLEAA